MSKPVEASARRFVIGVDSGGTFTDAVVIGDDGSVGVGKALTTDRRSTGVLDAVRAAAADVGGDALGEATLLAHGTTAGINTLLTRTGARVGMLTTVGFEDTLPIARADKTQGLEMEKLLWPTRWEKPPLLLPRSAIRGVVERVDAHGDVVTALDEAQARAAIRELRDQRVESIGVCLLWAIRNPAHEQRLAELIREELPGVPVSLSSDLAPRIGEYERAVTVMLNAYVTPTVTTYLVDLEQQLHEAQFRGAFLVMHSSGGVQRAETLAPRAINTLKSGPVGGLSAALRVSELLGHPNVICTDAGGTSFEVGLIVRGERQVARRPMVGRYPIATTMADIESIGTGGGSIAWVDPDTHALRVGPQSAGANPGPACYGRGGVAPTVTDAAVALGYLDRLGGTLELDPDAAREAIGRIAEPLGLDVIAAAEGVLAVAETQIADLIRRVTVQRGHDPREFALYAFGGAAPQYAGRYAASVGAAEVIVPMFASVFSAYGAVASDVTSSTALDAPQPFPPDAAWLAQEICALEQRARTELDDGTGAEPQVRRFLRMRFRRQVHEVAVRLPDRTLAAEDLAGVAERFVAGYEREFGAGSTPGDAPIELVGLTVEAQVPLDRPTPRATVDGTTTRGTRRACFGGAWHDCPVHGADAVADGATVKGPAFVDTATTTIVVYPGQAATGDAYGNVRLRLGGSR